VRVYAIWEGADAVKVGKTDGHPIERLRDLATGNPRRLRLLSYTSTLTEAEAHKRLSRSRVYREWYETAACLDLVKDWGFLDEELWRELHAELRRQCGT
jgi:hypothetical protein